MKKILFLIIDMQNGFVNKYTEGLDRKILDFHDKIKDRVITAGTRYVNHEHTACYLFEGWKDCMAGSKEAEIIRDNNVEKVYFAGVNTGCCVLHSAFDFYDDLVDCTVIEDLCGSTSGVKEHEEGIAVLRSCITKERVVTAEEALKEINLDLWGNLFTD